MNTVVVSPDSEIVIPLEVHQSLRIEAGQEVPIIQYDNHLELIPVRPIREARGMLKGIDTSIEREVDRV